MTTEAVTVTRDATAADAKTLAAIYRSLDKVTKAHKKAVREVQQGWLKPAALADLRFIRDEAQLKLDSAMDDAWAALAVLPKGTVAPGGATAQTVGLQFFNRNLNRTLGARITASEARVANKRSFAV